MRRDIRKAGDGMPHSGLQIAKEPLTALADEVQGNARAEHG
jgi:hypothetical protein